MTRGSVPNVGIKKQEVGSSCCKLPNQAAGTQSEGGRPEIIQFSALS